MEGGADYNAFGTSGNLEENGAATDSTSIVQMGARPYVPSIGRFLSIDPVQGGCANSYTYVFGDPVNQSDTSGEDTCDRISASLAISVGQALYYGSDDLASVASLIPVIGSLISPLVGFEAGAIGAQLLSAGLTANAWAEEEQKDGNNRATGEVVVVIDDIHLLGWDTGVPWKFYAVPYVANSSTDRGFYGEDPCKYA